MKYGYFDDERKEYVINNPETPSPWINYFGTGDFYSLFSNTGGGYCFYKDALLRRITRYRYNNIPEDMNGRYFYVRDIAEDGETSVWSPGWKPLMTKLDSYECRHGLGYSTISSSKNDVNAESLFFVPTEHNCEVHKVKLTNNSKVKKNLQLYSYVEFCLWNALDDMTNFQRNLNIGEVEVDNGTIYHLTEYRERRNHYSFYSMNREPSGFDTDRNTFIGQSRGIDNPECIEKGISGNSKAHGWYPCASHRLDIELEPGQSETVIFVLGYIENDDEQKWLSDGSLNKKSAKAMISALSTDEQVDEAMADLAAYWEDKLSHYSVKTDNEKLDRMVNIWNQYQCMVTYTMSRSASYYESGIGRGIGFRDTNQDLLGIMHMEPAKTRQRLIDVASIQLPHGGAFHQYQPLTKRGNDAIGGDFNDDPLWLIMAVGAYIRETGDFALLDEKVPFAGTDGHPLSDGKETIMADHLKKAFHYINENRGPHGLPLIGRADWNDCLNLNCFSKDPDESFQTVVNVDSGTAESVLIAAMLVYSGRELADLGRASEGKTNALAGEAEYAIKAVDEMSNIICENAWDGEWFLRAYDANSNKVGSSENAEGSIFIESQGFCGMAAVGADKQYNLKALDSVEKHLAHQYGIDILAPAFTSYDYSKGEITSYPPGYKENGGIFCHNNPWVIIAEAVAGRGDKAFDYYKRIAPAFIEDISDLHRTEPYVYAQMIAGSASQTPGQAKNSWLTGTAAWNFVAISQWILGIRTSYEGLIIDPCLPSDLRHLEVERTFRGVKYQITIENPEGKNKGEAMLVPFAEGTEPCKVVYTIK
ncbi:MAG: glycosyl transferase [Spirochaetales bacterium]|nr:glycosyl transferase [Spirochaetales bacterium]